MKFPIKYLINESTIKLSNTKESMYVNFVMKPSIPKAKCLIEVGNSSMLYIAKKVLPNAIKILINI